MVLTPSSRLLRRVVAAYLLLIAAVTVVYGWHNARAANDWAIGEWLINYSDGFVRRGLPGEVILLLAHASSVPIVTVTFALQIVVLGVFFVTVYRLTRGVRWSWPLLAILLSPATLAFHVLDPPAGFRKEILLFAGFSVLVAALVSRRWKDWQIAALLVAVAEICVLSHEPLVLYLPYLFGAVFLAIPEPRRAAAICSLPAVLAVATVLACARHPGTPAMAAAICSSVGGTLSAQNHGVCGGAILYLSRSLDYAREETRAAMHHDHYARLYSITGALALLPYALLFRGRHRGVVTVGSTQRSRMILLLTAGLSALASSLLFVVATDWGRWIYFHAVCLMLLALLVERPAASSAARSGGSSAATAYPARSSTDLILTPRWAIYAALTLVYATCWTLPHVGMFQGRFGYPSLAFYLRHYNDVRHSAE